MRFGRLGTSFSDWLSLRAILPSGWNSASLLLGLFGEVLDSLGVIMRKGLCGLVAYCTAEIFVADRIAF